MPVGLDLFMIVEGFELVSDPAGDPMTLQNAQPPQRRLGSENGPEDGVERLLVTNAPRVGGEAWVVSQCRATQRLGEAAPIPVSANREEQDAVKGFIGTVGRQPVGAISRGSGARKRGVEGKSGTG